MYSSEFVFHFSSQKGSGLLVSAALCLLVELDSERWCVSPSFVMRCSWIWIFVCPSTFENATWRIWYQWLRDPLKLFIGLTHILSGTHNHPSSHQNSNVSSWSQNEEHLLSTPSLFLPIVSVFNCMFATKISIPKGAGMYFMWQTLPCMDKKSGHWGAFLQYSFHSSLSLLSRFSFLLFRRHIDTFFRLKTRFLKFLVAGEAKYKI